MLSFNYSFNVICEIKDLILSFNLWILLIPTYHLIPGPFVGLIEQTIFDVCVLNMSRAMVSNQLPRVKNTFKIRRETTYQSFFVIRYIWKVGHLNTIH